MITLFTIAQERIITGSLFLVLTVAILMYVGCGWYRMGRKKKSSLRRAWTQKEIEEFEVLRHINAKEKR